MGYTKVILKGNQEVVIADIKKVYPDYPNDYEKTGESPLDRYIVTTPRQEVLTPATYNDQGEEITPAVLSDWVSKLVLPSGFDTSVFNTAQQ